MSRKTKKSDEGKFWTLRVSKSKGYKKPTFDVAKTFLIVCEGKNTEPKYFESFPVVTADIKTEGGLGSRTALVKAAIKLKQNEEYKGREVWCVFDYDHKPDNVTIEGDFNEAIALAKSLLCRNPIQTQACGTCPSCIWFAEGNHPDFRIISPEDADNTSDTPRWTSLRRNSVFDAVMLSRPGRRDRARP